MADVHSDNVPPSVGKAAPEDRGRDSQISLPSSSTGDESPRRRSSSRSAWSTIDDASNRLVRASALVTLLSFDTDASEHQVYSAEIAADLLREVSGMLSASQRILRPRAEDPFDDVESALVELDDLAGLVGRCAGRIGTLGADDNGTTARCAAAVAAASAGCVEVAKKALEQARARLESGLPGENHA